MAILPNTQDVTQFLGSSVGKPVDFNPSQQSQIPGGGQPTPMAHPQQPMQMPQSPYMPSSGPYNPYSQWAGLMNGPNAQGGIQTANNFLQKLGPSMPQMPQMGSPLGGVRSGTTMEMPQMAGGAPNMMQGMFRGPMSQ